MLHLFIVGCWIKKSVALSEHRSVGHRWRAFEVCGGAKDKEARYLSNKLVLVANLAVLRTPQTLRGVTMLRR
jgi:hypothetical protein